MKFYVYILLSNSLQKYYVGHTEDVEKRIVQHNSGKGNFTSKGVPWGKVIIIDCASKRDAIILENRIKKRGIRRYLQDGFIA